jgi:hypothetical protein
MSPIPGAGELPGALLLGAVVNEEGSTGSMRSETSIDLHSEGVTVRQLATILER